MTMRTTAGEQLADDFRRSALQQIDRHARLAAECLTQCAASVGPDYPAERAAHLADKAAFEALTAALAPFLADGESA